MESYNKKAGFALLLVAVGISGWFFYSHDHKPIPKNIEQDNHATKRKYTQQERKQILRAMIERNPELWRERYALGGIYLQERDFEQAIEQFKKIVKIRPQMIQAYNALGMCYLNQGKNTEALAIWKKAVEIEPGDATARDLIDRVEKEEERTKELRKLEKLVERSPNMAEAWYNLGEIYLTEKLFDRAIFSLKKASQLEPERADYHYKLGYTYLRMQDYSQAESALKIARNLDPDNDKIKRLLQDVQVKLQKGSVKSTSR